MKTTLPHIALIASVATLIASCGGGSEEDACSSEANLVISTIWNSNGSLDSRVSGKVGTPLIATPTISGIPASCTGQASFFGVTAMPDGLVLSRTTGVISGTPTRALGQGGDFVYLKLPGYKETKILGIINIAS